MFEIGDRVVAEFDRPRTGVIAVLSPQMHIVTKSGTFIGHDCYGIILDEEPDNHLITQDINGISYFRTELIQQHPMDILYKRMVALINEV